MPDQLSPFQKWWIKWSNWEFWPFRVLYFPVWFYYAWLAVKRGSLFFFTASNPTIEFGGMLGEEKSMIYKLIPEKYLPKTRRFTKSQKKEAQQYAIEIGYPIIAKPNIGERGTWVEKIRNQSDLSNYISHCPVPFLLQELIDYPIELGVFYVRHPGNQHGHITSIVQKEFLKVTGDGYSSIKELLVKDARASIQVDISHPRLTNMLEKIPKAGNIVEVESIGNHCRGTQFLNKNKLIDEDLNLAFDHLVDQIQGFHFGRFDLRCRSIDALKKLEHFKILELNGAGAEPGHIYQPGYSLWKAYRDILWHLATLAEISYQNKQRGTPYWSFRRGIKKIREIRNYDRILNMS